MKKIFIGLMAVLLITFNFTSILNAKGITDEYDSNVAGIGVSLASFINAENESSVNSKTEKETSPYENIAITHVSNYVNIRKKPNTNSEILGKIYDDSAAEILKTVDGENGKWYYIKSGNVKGYIKSEYFVTGEEAEKIAKEVGNVLCKTTAITLRLREKPDFDSKTITLLSEDSVYSVLKENVTDKYGNEFLYVLVSDSEDVDNDTKGYISADYADVYVEFEKAISIEEEKAELKRLEELKRIEEESIERQDSYSPTQNKSSNSNTDKPDSTSDNNTKKNKSSNSNKNKQDNTSDNNTNKNNSNSENYKQTSGIGSAIAAKAQQYVGWLPYVWGGTSLSSGADCSGFVQSIYSNYGISVPRTSSSQSSSGKTISYGELQIGDLVFYGSPINHVAIYIGNDQICHEANSRRDCTIDNIFYVTPTKYVTYLH